MKKGLIILLAIISMIFTSGAGYAAEERVLTKEQVIDLALSQSPEIIKSEQDLKIAQAKLEESEASLYPKVDLTSDYVRLGEAPTPVPGSENQYSLKLGFQHPLYTGGKIKNGHEITKKSLQQTELEMAKKKQELKKSVLDQYYGILKARKMLNLSKQTVDKIERYVEIARANRDAGIFTNTDVLKATVNLTRAKQGVLKAENGLKLAKMSLKNALGLKQDIEFKLDDELKWEEREVNPEQIKEYAFNHRSDLKLLDLSEEILKLNLEINRASKYPTVSVGGDYTTSATKLGDIDPFDGDWKVMFNLSYNLFDAGAKDAKIEQSVIEVDKFKETKKQTENMIELEINQSLLKLSEAEQSIELMELSLEEAEQNLEETEIKYQEGIATSFDVLDAQTTLKDVQSSYYQAICDYNLALVNLDKVMGKAVK